MTQKYKYRLVDNQMDDLKLPSVLTDSWKAPEGYYLEGYTDEVHLMCPNPPHKDELVASWQYGPSKEVLHDP